MTTVARVPVADIRPAFFVPGSAAFRWSLLTPRERLTPNYSLVLATRERILSADMPRISATIITYNEERQIERCIASVHDWCDEVIVLDSHSTDRTRELATAFPKVKFAVHDFDGHIQQKNRAIDMAAGPWIFSLDADEEATPGLAKSAREFVDNPKNESAQGVRIWRTTWHLGRFIRRSGWRNARYRLFRKGEGVWGGENPHDQVFLKGRPRWQRNRGPALKGDLIHYSFRDLSHQVDTINKFSSIIAFTRYERGTRFSLFKMLYKPLSKFNELYFFKLGFLDGMPGFIIAVSSAYATFLRWAKLYELRYTDLERPSNLRADYRVPPKSADSFESAVSSKAEAEAKSP